MGKGLTYEKSGEGATNSWITPKYIFDIFNEYRGNKPEYFDLDPCACIPQPWKTASKQYTEVENGLVQKWEGNVWCNPPYGPYAKAWVKRLYEHGNGIALIFARIETKLWQDYIFPTADMYLFPRGRIGFALPTGIYPNDTSKGTAPSAFIAWGEENARVLRDICLTEKMKGFCFGPADGVMVVHRQIKFSM